MKRVMQFILWIYQRSFFKVIQKTLIMLMPVAAVGSYFKILRDCIFSPDSLIYNLFNFDYSMSDQVWNLGNSVSTGMIQVTLFLFGIYSAYFVAVYTARIYHKDATMAGLSSVLVILFCSYLTSNTQSVVNLNVSYSRILNISDVLISILIGYAVGQVFHLCGQDYKFTKYERVTQIRYRAWQTLLPTSLAIILGLVFGLIIYYCKIHLIDSTYFTSLISELRSSNSISTVVPLTILSSLLWWSGIGYPLQSLTSVNDSGAALVNLNYALRHGNAANVPYKYLGSSLVKAYGLMGDAAIILSLAVVVLLFNHNKEIEIMVKLNLLPVAFGAPTGLAIGMPIILNPLFLVPVVLIPAINELIAAGGIALHLIMPAVYPILGGTPGILISFFGSNGNWPSFIFTILLFILNILIFVPFVLIDQKINKKVELYDNQAIKI